MDANQLSHLRLKVKAKTRREKNTFHEFTGKKEKKRKKAVSTFKSHLKGFHKVYYLNSKIIIYLRAKHLITAAAFVVSANISDSCCDK